MNNLSSASLIKTHPGMLPWAIGLFLIVITAAVYSPVRHHEFINFDDGPYVYGNKHVQSGLPIDSIKWAFTLVKSDERSYWHPVTWLSHMLDCQLFGIDPGYHHLSNLFYHLVNVLLLFLLLFRMTGALWKSATVAALFALHPVNVDSVAWIAERKNLLSTTFWMLTMLAYVRYAARPSAWRYMVTMLAFAIGLMAKPMLVTLPCALLLLDFWPLFRFKWFNECWLDREALPAADHPSFHKTSVNRLVIEKIPLLLLSFGAFWLSYLSLQKNSQILNEVVQPLGLRIANALVSYLHYLWKMVWPANLAIFYPFPKEIPLWQPIVSGMALIAVTALVVVYSRRKPYLATGWFWYLGTLTPVIGIIQGGLWPQIADRWVYVPFIGIFVLVVWGGGEITSRNRTKNFILPAIAAVILTVLAALTIIQLTYWKNDGTLFQHALNITRNNYLAYVHVGASLADRGDHAQAMWHYQKALDIQPGLVEAHEAMGEEYILLKNYSQALKHYQKALLFEPSSIDLYNKTGELFLLMGQYDNAIQYFKDARTIDPQDPIIYNNLGAAYLYADQMAIARQQIYKAIEMKKDYPDAYYNLALIEQKTGNTAEALNYFQKVVALNPEHAEAHQSLGKIFLQHGDMEVAINHFTQVVNLAPKNASAYYNIGAILYARQNKAEAVKYFQKALEIDPGYEKARAALGLMGQ